MSTTRVRQVLNGVDVARLIAVTNAIKKNPELNSCRFRATNTWLGGGHSRTKIQGFWGAGQEDTSRTEPFHLEGDEPTALLGTNNGPNAVEAVLHSLASCLAVCVVYNAAARGISIHKLEFDLEGELDIQAFLGISEETRPGYNHVQVNYHIDSDATDDQLDDLIAHVEKTSPVLDILRNPVPVSLNRE
ncbi:hypothetical protein Nstercoris_01160 [Nitrosomonas stercoris]|uniref:Protein YhfA n=1 Tax=Nitrosomonas stercoris TaxID=1444684 RepID=A0A4Y1YMG4_9PROT|nr:hypothetical protein Nstercoris_01160 [Nitrosomonas stercoris]